ncbi:hypothetical protein ACTA71_003850 [Dictyostelium dimigraforme]
MSDHSEAIATFQSITGASKEESTFYLESHGWDLEKAAQTYTTLQEEENQRNDQPQIEEDYEEEEDDHRDPMPPSRPVYSKPVAKTVNKKAPTGSSGGRVGGVRTLSDFNNDDHDDHDHGDGDEDDEDDRSQQYFTGGEKSGLVVESAPKKGKNGGSGDIVNDVFDSAKRHGAVASNEKKVEKPDSFDSVGYQLGATDQGNRNVSKPKEKDPNQQVVEVKVTFWNQGFTIDDGPLRKYDNPENKELLDDIQRGIVPRELQKKATTPNGLSVTLINNHNQDYVEPAKPKYVAFSGGGQTLGSSSSTSTTSSSSSSNNNNNNNNNNRTSTTSTTSTAATNVSINVDQSQPTTTVQIRLANGSRLSTTFNQTHTLQDVINYINNSSGSTQSFDLLTGFPQKPITTPTSTSLKDAGLLNALLIQKLK